MKRASTAALALLAATLLSSTQVLAAERADRIWSGGPILTMDDTNPRPEAVAEKDGEIIAVGSEADVMKLKSKDTKIIDLGGRAMLPGFVDAHGHAFMIGIQAAAANLQPAPDGKVNDLDALESVLTDWSKAHPDRLKRQHQSK